MANAVEGPPGSLLRRTHAVRPHAVRPRTAATVLLAAASLAVLSSSSRADDDTDDRRRVARILAERGDAHFGSGRCDRALPAWREAERMYHAPTLVLRIARCQALLGQVLQAAEQLSTLLEETLPETAPAAFWQARQEAEAELPAIRSRIARLTVRVIPRNDPEPAPMNGPFRLEVDGAAVTPGAALQLNPGLHRVHLQTGDERRELAVHLGDGEQRRLDLVVHASKQTTTSTTQRAVGFALGAVGVAGLALGTAFGLSALGISSELEGQCGPDRRGCPAARSADIDRLQSHALVSEVAFVVGAISLLGGATFVWVAPRGEQRRVVITPVGLAATGEF